MSSHSDLVKARLPTTIFESFLTFVHVSFSSPEYVALYTYESPEPGDLTFMEGDVILVSKREGEWWNGSIGDRTGLFPSNYVKPKEADVRTLNTYVG